MSDLELLPMRFLEFATSLDWNWAATANISTFVVALLTFFTLWEMRKARVQSIAPQLILLSPVYRYEFRWIPLEDPAFIIRPELIGGETNKYQTRLPVFLLKNLGNGAAQSINIRWKVKEGCPIELIKESEILRKYNPRVESGLFYLTVQNAHGTRGSGVPCQSEENSNLPYSIASPATDFSDPVTISDRVLNNYCFRLICLPRMSQFALINAPSVYVDIEYLDLYGRKHKRHFVIESQLTFIPDAIQSSTNSVDAQFHNPDNVRGTIRFTVTPTAG